MKRERDKGGRGEAGKWDGREGQQWWQQFATSATLAIKGGARPKAKDNGGRERGGRKGSTPTFVVNAGCFSNAFRIF